MMAADPLARLKRAMELGAQRPTLRWEDAPQSDPLEALEALVQRGDARQKEEPLEQLHAWLTQGRELARPEPWTPGQGDPLERLLALWQHPEAPALPASLPPSQVERPAPAIGAPEPRARASNRPSSSRAGSTPAASEALGEQVYQSLARRPLSGELRAEISARVAAILSTRTEDDPELRAVLDLLIFER